VATSRHSRSNVTATLHQPRGNHLQRGRYNCSLTKRGAFISFEGIDGSGKTTQLRRLENTLSRLGHSVVVAQEPGGTRVGAEIRKLLLDAANSDLRPIPELLLYFASRSQNIAEVIRPALHSGQIVLSDRFTDATIAYQGFGRELGVEAVRAIEAVACEGLKPDLTLLLDMAPGTGVQRALERNTSRPLDESRMEQEGISFYERVRGGYIELQRDEPERMKLVGANGDIGEVEARVNRIVTDFLETRGEND